ITVKLVQEESYLSCTIADCGIGIRSEELDKIFHPLYRSDALDHKEIVGMGLGLSIVAKACALLNIERTIQSKVGQGTRFTLQFPLA
ncbi:MAG: ATP-binding protein, partial [Cytophagaceae bacterium]